MAVAALGVLLLASVGVWAAGGRRAPCLGEASASSIESFVEAYPVDTVAPFDGERDEGAVQRWLHAASEASHEGSSPEEANEVISKVLSDPAKFKDIFHRAVRRAAMQTASKRSALKSFVDTHRHSLGSRTSRATANAQMQRKTASCVFDALGAVNAVAWIAANINDAAQTCKGVNGNFTTIRGAVCMVNAAFAVNELSWLATWLSLAAGDCAASLVPNVDASCAASVTGLIYFVTSLGVGASMAGAACNKQYIDKVKVFNIPVSSLPAFLMGSTGAADAGGHDTGGGDDDTGAVDTSVNDAGTGDGSDDAAGAIARRLIVGGGHGSTGTMCGVEVTGALWELARAALSISGAADGNMGPLGQCEGSSASNVRRAYCTKNVAAILRALLSVFSLIQLALVHCADVLNLAAVCGTGVTTMMSSLAGIAEAGSGLYLACNVFQDPKIKHSLNLAKNMHLPPVAVAKTVAAFGHRLHEDEAEADDFGDMSNAELARRFGTPQALFKKLGFDLEDPQAEFRRQQPQPSPLDNVASLFEESPSQKLFDTCDEQ